MKYTQEDIEYVRKNYDKAQIESTNIRNFAKHFNVTADNFKRVFYEWKKSGKIKMPTTEEIIEASEQRKLE